MGQLSWQCDDEAMEWGSCLGDEKTEWGSCLGDDGETEWGSRLGDDGGEKRKGTAVLVVIKNRMGQLSWW